MILTVFRHGEAADAASDYARRLTAWGEEDVARAGHALASACQARKIAPPDVLCCSPWIRTMATADILSLTLPAALAEVVAALQPGAKVRDVEAMLEERQAAGAPAAHMLLVSHQPLVSRLINHWLDEDGRVPSLSPGAFASLEMDSLARGCGHLLFWASPPTCEPVA